jgi:hypothetical protein
MSKSGRRLGGSKRHFGRRGQSEIPLAPAVNRNPAFQNVSRQRQLSYSEGLI